MNGLASSFLKLNAFTIKLIAIISMFIDHAGLMFDLHSGARVIGRLAFPLFVYLIAEGCRHSKNMNKYLMRLGLFALISEIPFDIAFGRFFGEGINFLSHTNIFYTLFLGVFCVYIHKVIKDNVRQFALVCLLSLIPLIIAMIMAHTLGSDYGFIGVLFIFTMAVFGKSKIAQSVVIGIFMLILYLPAPAMLIAGLTAIPITLLASGELGPRVKWMFYVAYPLHLALFSLLMIW